MNFLTHYALDRESPSSYFTVGVAIPDLLPVAGRNLRLPYKKMLDMGIENAHSEQDWMTQGIIRHFHTDQIFHESRFFHSERALILPYLKKLFVHAPEQKYFFLTHVLVELYLDRILLSKDPELGKAYYSHFHNIQPQQTLDWLELLTEKNFSPLLKTLSIFRDSAFLLDYTRDDAFYYALKRTVLRTGIVALEAIPAHIFHETLYTYEQGLKDRIHSLFPEIRESLPLVQ